MFDQNDPYAAIATPLATPTPGRPPMLGQPTRAPMVGPPPTAQPDPSGYRPQGPGLAPIPGGPADPTRPGGPMDPETQLSGDALDMQAQNYLDTNTLPSLGMGGSGGARQRILNRAAQMARAAGVNGADLATLGANYRALRQTLQSQQMQLGNLRSMEGTANDNFEALRQASHNLPGQTEIPLVNRMVHAAQRNMNVTGHDQISAYDVAYNTAIDEYARIIATGSSGNGQVTDSMRNEAQGMIPYGSSPSQLDSAIAQARIDMGNRGSNYERTVARLQSQLSGRPVQTPPHEEIGAASSMWGQAGAQGALPPGPQQGGGIPPPAFNPPPTGGQPPAPGGTGLGNAAGALIHGMNQQQGQIEFGGSNPAPSGFEAEQIARYDQFMRDNPQATAAKIQAAFPRVVNAQEIVTARDRGAGVQSARGYQMQSAVEADRAAAAARAADDARLAAQTPQQRLSDSMNPLRHPVEAAFQGATGVPFLTGSGDQGQAAFSRGVLDIPTFSFRDEINGAARGGTGIADERALDRSDWQNHPFLRGGGEVAGALAIPAAGPELGGFRAALMSGAQGMGYGLGSGEGDLSQRAPGAALGLATGLALPPLLNLGGRGARALLSRAPQISQDAQRIAQAGADESVPLSRPIVDPTSRAQMMRLESNIGGHAPVRQSLDATQQGIENRVGQLAPNGTADERGAMGSRIQEAGRNYVSSSGQRIGAMYDRASQMAGGTQVLPGTAVQRLDTHLAQLQQNPETNAGLINYLGQVRRDLVDEGGILRPKTVQAIRDMRTNLRGQIDNAGLTHSNAERIMNDVLEGAGHDVNFFLGAQNPAANKLYQQADQEWAGRHREITQIVDRLVGRSDNPMGGGQVMTNVSGLMSGDVPRLRRVMAMLSPAERNDLAATVASRAGYKSSDQPFDLQQFITWQKAIPDSARQVVFGPDGARSIQNLTILTRALQDTQKALNNSRSGAARNAAAFWQSTLGGFLPGGAVGVMTGTGATTAALAAGTAQAGVAGAQALARRLSAKALMNPDMSRWLAVAPRMSTAGAIRSHIGRLAGIAARNPGLEQEILPFRDSLLNAANDNAERAAAASGPNQNQQQPR